MTRIVASKGWVCGSLAWALALSLSVVACVRDHSLGAVPDQPDGSADHQPTADGNDAPQDAPVDLAADLAADLASGGTCADDGVSYQVGDLIRRGTATCMQTCICLNGGVVGRCTGVLCPTDGSSEGARDTVRVALITVSRSTNSPEIQIPVYDNGSARRNVIGGDGSVVSLAFVYPPGSPEALCTASA